MRFTITSKIIAGVAIVLLTGIAAMAIIFDALTTVEKSLHEITDVEMPISAAAYEMEINLIETGVGVVNYMVSGETQFRERVVNDRGDFERAKAQYDRLTETAKGEELGKRLVVLYREFTALGDRLMKKRENGDAGLFETGEFKRFIELRVEMDELLDEEIQNLTMNDLQTSVRAAGQAHTDAVRLVAVLVPVFVLFSVGAALLMVRSITNAVKNLMQGTEAISQGKFDYRVADSGGDDEFTDLLQKFNRMAAELEATTVAKDRLEASEKNLQEANASLSQEINERRAAEEERARLHEEIIVLQAARLEELSTPLIPLSPEIVVMPLIGTVDAERAQRMLDAVSQGVVAQRARVAIIDITGVPTVDTQVASALVQTAGAVRLLGAEVVLTGIRARVAQTLVGLGVDFSNLVTRKTLQNGVEYAGEHLRASSRSLESKSKET